MKIMRKRYTRLYEKSGCYICEVKKHWWSRWKLETFWLNNKKYVAVFKLKAGDAFVRVHNQLMLM